MGLLRHVKLRIEGDSGLDFTEKGGNSQVGANIWQTNSRHRQGHPETTGPRRGSDGRLRMLLQHVALSSQVTLW